MHGLSFSTKIIIKHLRNVEMDVWKFPKGPTRRRNQHAVKKVGMSAELLDYIAGLVMLATPLFSSS